RDGTIAAPYRGLVMGESIAVSGACLTVAAKGRGWFGVRAVGTTLERTRLGSLHPGDRVNLERALRAGDRLGGHIVQGHVDGVGVVEAMRPEGTGARTRVRFPAGLSDCIVTKGSIAVDGVSLTVADVRGRCCEVALIPETLASTRLREYAPGTAVNLDRKSVV